MSYILDALKKAAEQRDRQAPVLKRLLGPSATPRSVWARAPGRLLAALVLNASLLAVLLVIWLRPMATVAPPEAVDVAAPATSPSLAGLRLEALIYSEVPEKRMIFVNGRKYVEGDTIEGRLRVEEIREDGVALSGEGHRVTLGINR